MIRRISPGNLRDISWVCSNLRESDRREVFSIRANRDLISLAEDLNNLSKESWVIKWHEFPVSILGACDLGHGVLSCWMLATDRWRHVALTTTNFIKDSFIPSLVARGYWRGEIFAINGNPVNLRWLEFLGFKKSALCKGVGINNEDFYFYIYDFRGK